MSFPTIAEEFRGGVLENAHQGLVCVIDQYKNIIYQKGNTNQSIFFRSAMKPLQAIPVFSTNVIKKYGVSQAEAALFTASQRGEIYHQQALLKLAKKLGFSENQLSCGSSYPLNEQAKLDYIKAGNQKSRLLHNCAGKHLGFLAYAREKGYPLENYEAKEHPLQLEILEYVAELSELDKTNIHVAMDGCGVPVFALDLYHMAISYLKFASPSMIQNTNTVNAVKQINTVMHAHPEIVASYDFICTILLEDKNIIAKGGAQGVYCLALKKEKISIALKVMSGTEKLWPLIVATLLEKIGYTNKKTIERLNQLRNKHILNDEGNVVGEIRLCL
ncbi:asparaginase [Oceanobacillus sp. 1P07AA]|uniref:asparaginase n=1 Tax=Oceanobacillus sp. 1P07AA TaxID=3132293 RepID=UPI0039A7796D